jgi:hypothetical protein
MSVGGLFLWLAHLKLPEAGIASIEVQTLKLDAPIKISVYSKLWINNPNGWPMSGTIEVLDANVTSLDKNNERSQELYIGVASLSQPVKIATHSNTSFTVKLKADNAEAALLQRLKTDCGPLSKELTTKIAVHINKAKISIWNRRVPLEDLHIGFNATIPCPRMGDVEHAAVASISPDSNDTLALIVV